MASKNDRLKIVIVCYPTYGGSGILATELGLAMAERGHQVYFVSTNAPRRLDRLGAKNIFLYTCETMNYPLFEGGVLTGSAMTGKLHEVIMKEKPDLINVHYAVPFATSALRARDCARIIGNLRKLPKIVCTLHGTDVNVVGSSRSYQVDTMFSVLECDGVTVPSYSLRTAAYDKLRIPSEKVIEVIPNFVDSARFSPARDKKQILQTRKSFGIVGSKKPVLCHVSNFREVKRIPDVIKIFAQVQKKIPSMLMMVGDGPERQKAEALTKEMGLEQSVIFLGRQRHFESILQASDIFLLPSETESFGLAALEAMACGIPVVASDVGGIPEVVIHGETGYLSEVGDTTSMADNCVRLLKDREQLSVMSQKCRKRAQTVFGLNEIVSSYESYFRKVMTQRAK